MTESNSSLRHGTVYCTADYSESCSINQVTANQGRDEWICDTNGSSTCNTGTVGFYVEVIRSNAECIYSDFLGYFSSTTSCAHYAMELNCTGDQIMWAHRFTDALGCYCCQNTSTDVAADFVTFYSINTMWDVYQYGINNGNMTTTGAPSPSNIGNPTEVLSAFTTLRPSAVPTFSPTTWLDSQFGFPMSVPTSSPTTNPTVAVAPTADPSEDFMTTFDIAFDSSVFFEDDISTTDDPEEITEHYHPFTLMPGSDHVNTTEIVVATPRDTFEWSIHETIYAVFGVCSVCSIGFAIAVLVYSKRKLNQLAEEEGSIGDEGMANLDDHPSLDPDSSQFVPGKAHPAHGSADHLDKIQSLAVKVPVMEHTPSSLESIIPEQYPDLEGQPTGDDV